MFDLPKTNVRLRAFRPSDEELFHKHLLNVFDLALRTEVRFPVPKQTSDRYAKGAKENAEMFCVIETIPPRPSLIGNNLKGGESEKQDEEEQPEFIGFVAWWRDQSAAMRQASYSISIRKNT